MGELVSFFIDSITRDQVTLSTFIQSVNKNCLFHIFQNATSKKNRLTPHRFVSNDNFEIEANIFLVAFPLSHEFISYLVV